MKSCRNPDCNQVNPQPLENFFKDKAFSDGHASRCKACKTAATLEWRRNNREKYNAGAVDWGRRNPHKRHLHEIKRRYGCTEEQYNAMLTAQSGVCNICKAPHDTSIKKGRLYVDHCHKSGKIRSLLCGKCNSMLGYAKDNIEIMLAAIKYLATHAAD